MTPDDAKKFINNVTPSRSRRNAMKFVQDKNTRATIMKDPDKGLEKVARVEAEINGYSWSEKWGFLSSDNEYINLQTTEGLMKLEKHLESRLAEQVENNENRELNLNDTIDDISAKFGDLTVSNG